MVDELGVDLVEALGELGDLVEDELGVGIHGSLAATKSSEVVVRRDLQDDGSHPDQSGVAGITRSGSSVWNANNQRAPPKPVLDRSMGCSKDMDTGRIQGPKTSDTNC